MYKKYVVLNLLLLLFVYLPPTLQKALDTTQYLHMYGFLHDEDPDQETLKNAIKKYQKTTGLDVTGEINEGTLKQMSSPRCGRPSNVPMFAGARNKWRKSEVTYKIQNFTAPFTLPQIRKTFDDSIRQWTNGVNLKIRESSSNDGDINVYFSQQDGSSNTLGYAYFPENGDIYFDRDEEWTLQTSTRKIFFGWVAAHELGHALGLPHSETRRSIMYPYYSETVSQPADIDINTLKRLYGQATVDKSILCNGPTICAMLDLEEDIIIRQRQYWTLSRGSVKSGPFNLETLFPGLPNTIDAAFSVRKTVYILKDNVFYRFKPNRKTWTKKLISTGFESIPSGINAAFFAPSTGTIYFFKGSKYYAFDTTKSVGKRLIVNGKNIASDWNGVPNDVEAAAMIDNNVLFIKKSRCYTVDLASRQLLRDEDCKTSLFKC